MCLLSHLLNTDAPLQLHPCEACDGEGIIVERIEVYERGCAFSHPDTAEHRCTECGGSGFDVVDVEPDHPRHHRGVAQESL